MLGRLPCAIGLLCVTGGPAAADVVGKGELSVELNRFGVLTRVPRDGLVTVDGPKALMKKGFAEWYGISYDKPGSADHEFVGPGAVGDWGDRSIAEVISFTSDGETAVAEAQAGDLRVRTEFWIDETGPYLIAAVTLTNTGDQWLFDIIYTREFRSAKKSASGWTFPTDWVVRPAPPELMRRLWMPDDLRPGASTAIGFSYKLPGEPLFGPSVDVPLAQWTHADFPTGLNYGATNGVSVGDYDADGWPDVFSWRAGNLWRNVDGQTWTVSNINALVPADGTSRYGSSFGDYNNDGYPDLVTEPRGSNCMRLIKNLGTGPLGWVELGSDPSIIDVQPCGGTAETNCWGDVDGDANLDMFYPAYPSWAGGPGNYFLFNLGPTGPGGSYRFAEQSSIAGLDNPPPASARSEGAQFLDIDFDGDMDLYSNGTLYQNVSSLGTADFDAMTENGSGIGFSTFLEEGAAFADYDLDGDYDLLIVYTNSSIGVRIWENYGDGNFFGVEAGVVESPSIGLDLGLSTEDWDNDGDMDFTTRQVFRRNMLMETGERRFKVATHNIPGSHLVSATPAWFDWDKDGDLDCALGDWQSTGNFYENTLYDETTPDAQRRYVRVRPLRDSTAVPAGLETEYATNVEIHILGDTTGQKRRKFTASAGGYLNQNEYTLHFALPDDPAPADPVEDVRFDVTADFPNLPVDGIWRVDKHVNPALGNINLADLTSREIIVFRSGVVIIDGTEYPPSQLEQPLLTTAGGGLALPTAVSPLSVPLDTATEFHFVGLDFDTIGATTPLRLREVIVDGQFGISTDCGKGPATLALWDITDPNNPVQVEDGLLVATGSDRNRRHCVRSEALLRRERHYRLIARVNQLRASPFSGPVNHPDMLNVHGGLTYFDTNSCSTSAMDAAAVDPNNLYLTIRVAPYNGVIIDEGTLLPFPDAGGPAADPDAGDGNGGGEDSTGCGCRVGERRKAPAAVGLLLIALVALRRKR